MSNMTYFRICVLAVVCLWVSNASAQFRKYSNEFLNIGVFLISLFFNLVLLGITFNPQLKHKKVETFLQNQFPPFDLHTKSPIFAIPKKRKNMLIIDSKDCENIDKALKKYKKKYEKSKTLLQLRERQAFIKPSIRRRGEMLKAIYKQKIFNGTIES